MSKQFFYVSTIDAEKSLILIEEFKGFLFLKTQP